MSMNITASIKCGDCGNTFSVVLEPGTVINSVCCSCAALKNNQKLTFGPLTEEMVVDGLNAASGISRGAYSWTLMARFVLRLLHETHGDTYLSTINIHGSPVVYSADQREWHQWHQWLLDLAKNQ